MPISYSKAINYIRTGGDVFASSQSSAKNWLMQLEMVRGLLGQKFMVVLDISGIIMRIDILDGGMSMDVKWAGIYASVVGGNDVKDCLLYTSL